MPYFRKAAGRSVHEHGSVTTASFPQDGWGPLSDLSKTRLLSVADHLFAPETHLDVSLGPDTTTVFIVLAGSVHVQPWEGVVRALPTRTSIVCAAPERTRGRVANPSDNSARIVQVTLAGAERRSVVQGSDMVSTAAATVSVNASGFDSNARPGLVYVCAGSFTNEAVDVLNAGDWCEFPGYNTDIAIIQGHGQLLVIELTDALSTSAGPR